MTPAIHAYISALAPTWDDMTVVELGAGVAPGQEDLALADVIEQGARYIGIDATDGRNIDYTVDLTEVSRESDVGDVIAEADVVLCLETLEHIPAFWRVLDTFSWMKPGATLVVSVPAFGFGYHAHPVDCYRFHEDAAPVIMAGFDVVETVRLPDTIGQQCIVWRGVKR